jgi:hypothetical protein
MIEQQTKKGTTETKIQAKEKMLEALFEYAAACHVENLNREYANENNAIPDFTPTPEFEKKMKRLIARYQRRRTLAAIKARAFKSLPKAAIFLLLVGGILTIVVTSVDALRIRALNMFLNARDQYTSVEVKENVPGQTAPESQTIPSDWNAYVPAYTPQGFQIVGTKKDNVTKFIEYANPNGQTIRFTQYENIKTDLQIDTENATVQDVIINNNKALLVEKAGIASLIWQDQKLFYFTGEVDKSELIRMAQSLQKK